MKCVIIIIIFIVVVKNCELCEKVICVILYLVYLKGFVVWFFSVMEFSIFIDLFINFIVVNKERIIFIKE